MPTYLSRRDLLEMTGMDLAKFQSRQRRDQIPSSLKMQDGTTYDGERGGYPLGDVLSVAFADALVDDGLDPAQAKMIAEDFMVRQKLSDARASGAPCWLAVVMLTPGKGLSIATGRNPSHALQEADKKVAIVGIDNVASVRVFDFSGRLSRINAVSEKLKLHWLAV